MFSCALIQILILKLESCGDGLGAILSCGWGERNEKSMWILTHITRKDLRNVRKSITDGNNLLQNPAVNITGHSGINTGITLAVNSNVPVHQVRIKSGHSTVD
eukprot:TRINITY_DN5054_c0_g1_i1.p1 TRINITY_DN5054_c0_g1~~TRINITY_DN5054_c0_g1_i1.p1  ORF type:complete len:103 (-),score=7.09 TRINITY_DN5054_c0_g1_i1:152-460(-)